MSYGVYGEYGLKSVVYPLTSSGYKKIRKENNSNRIIQMNLKLLKFCLFQAI